MEIRHESYWYDKEKLPYLTSTHLVFFDEVHIQQISVPAMTNKLNEHKIRFPRYEEGNIGVKNGKYDTNNRPKKSTFKYEQEGRFCLGVANIESNIGTITNKKYPVFDYSEKKKVTIDAYMKVNQVVFARFRKLISS